MRRAYEFPLRTRMRRVRPPRHHARARTRRADRHRRSAPLRYNERRDDDRNHSERSFMSLRVQTRGPFGGPCRPDLHEFASANSGAIGGPCRPDLHDFAGANSGAIGGRAAPILMSLRVQTRGPSGGRAAPILEVVLGDEALVGEVVGQRRNRARCDANANEESLIWTGAYLVEEIRAVDVEFRGEVA